MRKTKYPALGKQSLMTFSGYKEFKTEYAEAIAQINERKNEDRIKQIALEQNESEEVIIAKLESDKDFRDEIHGLTKDLCTHGNNR